jgi:hypothetical protein
VGDDHGGHAGSLTETQRRIVDALSRPLREDGAYASPATNQQIADEVFLSVDAVKGHLRALYAKLGIEHLPQNRKRARLAELAVSGALGEATPPPAPARRRFRRPSRRVAVIGAAALGLASPALAATALVDSPDGRAVRGATTTLAEAAPPESPSTAPPAEVPPEPTVEGDLPPTVFGERGTTTVGAGGAPAVSPAPAPTVIGVVRDHSPGPPPHANARGREIVQHVTREVEARAPKPPPAAQQPPPAPVCTPHEHVTVHQHTRMHRHVTPHVHLTPHEHVRMHPHVWVHRHVTIHIHRDGRRHRHVTPHEHVRMHRHVSVHQHRRVHRHVVLHPHVTPHRHVQIHQHCG